MAASCPLTPHVAVGQVWWPIRGTRALIRISSLTLVASYKSAAPSTFRWYSRSALCRGLSGWWCWRCPSLSSWWMKFSNFLLATTSSQGARSRWADAPDGSGVVCFCSVSKLLPLLSNKSLEEEEELNRMRATSGLVGAMVMRLRQALRGVSWSFVLISTPLVIWIFSLDSDITNIFWEWWQKEKTGGLLGEEWRAGKKKENWW